MERWQQREAEWGQRFFLRTGQIQLATEWTPFLKDTKRTFDQRKIAYEELTPEEVAHRYPQLDTAGIAFGVFTPGTGVLRAREGCLAVARAFERKGGRLLTSHAAPGRPLLRDAASDQRFSYPHFPTRSTPGAYGFPSVDGKGFKVAPPGDDTMVDPDVQERIVTPEETRRGRELIARWFPALRDQPLVESRVCQYENSVDAHFFVARHPALENVWLVGGGSGQGYKHGIMFGEYVARRVLEKDTPPELKSAFALKPEGFSG